MFVGHCAGKIKRDEDEENIRQEEMAKVCNILRFRGGRQRVKGSNKTQREFSFEVVVMRDSFVCGVSSVLFIFVAHKGRSLFGTNHSFFISCEG
jgi:hypothetical protein